MAWRKVGAGWNTDRGGISLSLSEDLEEGKYLLFKNDHKKKDTHPDWNLCVKEDEVEPDYEDMAKDEDIPF